jgi:hypothetical protein
LTPAPRSETVAPSKAVDRKVSGLRRLEGLEEPQLAFREYAIAFHLAARWIGEGAPPRALTRDERALESYEDDMLLYAHRDERPFRTRVVPCDVDEVTVGFAHELVYEAEGEEKRVVSETPSRTFAIVLGETVFERSEVAVEHARRPLGVLTLALTPGDELNEYDVIKLVKLWEGGESVGSPSAIREGTDLWFAVEPGRRDTLHELVRDAFHDWQPLAYSATRGVTSARRGFRSGTVELYLPDEQWRESLFADLATLKRRREAPEDPERWHRVVAVGGILQGLLDFRAIEGYELADVFAEIDFPEDEEMRAFHKGTLLSLAAEDTDDDNADERPSPLGVDPYLAVPNIVLLHNEQRLKSARRVEAELSARQRGPARQLLERAAINKTENGLSDMARLLAQDLPNVFHYTSERRLQKRGRQSRGLDDLNAFVRLRMEDLSSVLESRVRTRDRWTAVLGIAVGVVTAFLVQQAIQGRPLWLIVIAAVTLFAVFLWLRDRLF